MRSAVRPLLVALLCAGALLTLPQAAGAKLAWERSVGAAQSLFGGAPSTSALLRAAHVRRHHARFGRELSPVLAELGARFGALHGAERRQAQRLLARPTDGAADPQQNGYTAPEAPRSPYCSPHFCVHWVATGNDAPDPASSDGSGIPDYVRAVAGVAENVFNVENVQLGWRMPKGDGTLGGGFNQTDIYLKNLGGSGIYGYTTPDPGQSTAQSNQLFAYLVIDSSFSQARFPRYTSPLVPLEVTLAHEYNHVLQFNLDSLEDTWMFESTAVWMEGRVYPEAHDYFQYLPGWTSLTQVPLTTFNGTDPNDRSNVKVYGSSVWNKFLDALYGPDVIRDAWLDSVSVKPRSFAPSAYDASLRSHGSPGFVDAFSRFAAQTAEWQSPGAGFPDGAAYPDVQRIGRLAVNATGGLLRLDHTTFGLIDVPPSTAARVKLVVSAPAGTASALALVGRGATGETTRLTELARGGAGSVVLDSPGAFNRLTAVVTNADVSQSGYSQAAGDWLYTKNAQPYLVRVTTDFTLPRARAQAPHAGQRGVGPRTSVSIAFSKPMIGVTAQSLELVGPNGRRVRARVSFKSGSRRATLTPVGGLRRGATYRVRLAGAITDTDLNRLPRTTFTFQTAR